ncbi:Zn-ribbon domain-containing OB-fold protein [Zavarzinia sp. CC-PAN008]|uniref:Zn-ribbon domain-containing OB-fold protein n=1 Tax=Zavarzinia sp. CC-PAN008 TaxID=3243332 RepID=UPI003F749EF6
MTATTGQVKPAVPYLKVPEQGQPFLAGSKCSACGSVYVGERKVCAKCLGRDTLQPIHLGDRGRLYSYTIVHRSFPGVPVPFVAAVIDLEGGGTINGTLTDVTPDPAALPFDMPVRVVIRDTGQKDAEGRAFIAPYFIPA